jgi:DNA-binding GntR family transcriptional regulator
MSRASASASNVTAKRTNALLTDVAYDSIKERIVRCVLAPGTEVTEGQLAAHHMLGRAPVRAALLRLGQERLVRALPRRGYLITPITVRDVDDIFELRLLLEPAAARRAAGHVDMEQLRRLDALCRAGYAPGDRESAAVFLRANKEFHVTIARASGNERLADALAGLLDSMERLFHLGLRLRNRTQEMQHEHKALVEALAAGDGRSAERISSEQIEAAKTMVMDAILSSSSVRSVRIVANAGTE